MAAEAAAKQDSFWEMHGALYTHQHALDNAHLVGYAIGLGLDPASFRRAMVGRSCEMRVREDFFSGVRSGVNGTPTFFIEGFRYDGTPDFDSLLAVLAAAASEKEG